MASTLEMHTLDPSFPHLIMSPPDTHTQVCTQRFEIHRVDYVHRLEANYLITHRNGI